MSGASVTLFAISDSVSKTYVFYFKFYIFLWFLGNVVISYESLYLLGTWNVRFKRQETFSMLIDLFFPGLELLHRPWMYLTKPGTWLLSSVDFPFDWMYINLHQIAFLLLSEGREVFKCSKFGTTSHAKCLFIKNLRVNMSYLVLHIRFFCSLMFAGWQKHCAHILRMTVLF